MQTPQKTAPGSVPFGQSCVILDVRTGLEHADVALKQPHHHVPLGDLKPSEFLARNNIDPARPIYVLCRSGKRATTAAEAFIAAGHSNVHVVEGGIVACEAAGVPVRKGKVISLERQVRIAAGLLVVTGAALGAFASPLFYFVPAFVGAGLVFAGVTDKCGMALMLAKAPWNAGVQQQQQQPAATACSAAASACAAAPAAADVSGLKMPSGGTAFYSPSNGKPAPVQVHALTKAGGSAGGCS